MKKITIIALHLSHGGIENYIASLANMLVEKYDVNIIATYKLCDKPAYEIDKRVKIKYLTNVIPNKEELLKAKKSNNIFFKAKEYIKAFKIIRLKKETMIKTAKELDCDIVITTREIHNEIIGKYADKNIIKIASDHNHHNNDKDYISTLLASLYNTDYFMPVSKDLYNFYKPLLTSKTKVKYISHTLDNYPSKVSKLKTKNILAIGRLNEVKKFDDMIKLFSKLDKSYKLDIIGDGEEKDNLESLIKELKLEDQVTLHGYKSKKEIEEFMLNSSLFLLTSRIESFGLVVIEAMSYGVPVIIYDDAKGALELVTNGKNGFIINNRNEEDMINKISLVLEDNPLRESLGSSAREFSKNYSKEVVAKEWYEFIDSIKR